MLQLLLSPLVWSLGASATLHHMFVGTYGGSGVYAVTYDDTTRALTSTKSNTTREDNEWLALSYDGKTLYSSGLAGWSSFPITSPTTIGASTGSSPSPGQCAIWQGIFILASRRAPYSVYGTLSCARSKDVGAPAGQVGRGKGEVVYNETAVMYGMDMDPSNQYLYTSDFKSGKIWTHKVNKDGSLTALASVEGPSPVGAPRTVVVHPSGKSLYVVLEGWNVLALYAINATTHLPEYMDALFNLVPPTETPANYAAHSAVVSTKGSVLWATTSSKVGGKPGFITGFRLQEDGQIIDQIFQVNTPTGGGKSNNLAASPFADNMVALTESERGSVSLWRYDNVNVKQIASVQIHDAGAPNKGCCSEAVWLD
ncbi:3-carboxy-cis,cis-mucoante lactonizing enzyme [Microthyrium microscopicum]|uniref:3-carboxy-cis,cis-mucoante lactonizing enzyme n=1 Tax=Microthyrium microscopicum TaxID=703497 RepID=A0A6A6UKB5_9PEZI|nr:3-carboxy-cis,cis-mucoante lactonizing enzyme [Microthyrium microscopicum]